MPRTDRSVALLTGMIIAALYVILLVGFSRESYMRRDAAAARAELSGVSALAFAVNLAPEESDFTMLDEKGLRELLPGLQRLGVLELSTNPYHRAVRKEFEQACLQRHQDQAQARATESQRPVIPFLMSV